MEEFGHFQVGYFDDKNEFWGLVWPDGSPVFVDDLNRRWAEQDSKISRIYAKLRKPKKFNARQVEHLKRRRKEGASLRDIAKEMGCSEGTVRNYLKRE